MPMACLNTIRNLKHLFHTTKLILETHFTGKTYATIPNYSVYATNHPDGTAHAATAFIVKNSIKHNDIQKKHIFQLQKPTEK